MTKLTIQDWGLMIDKKVLLDNKIVRVMGVILDLNDEINIKIDDDPFTYYRRPQYNQIKPILRTIDQMTEEDKEEFGIIHNETGTISEVSVDFFSYWIKETYLQYRMSLEGVDFLTRKGYDIRGWIDQGLAIKYDPEKHGEFK